MKTFYDIYQKCILYYLGDSFCHQACMQTRKNYVVRVCLKIIIPKKKETKEQETVKQDENMQNIIVQSMKIMTSIKQLRTTTNNSYTSFLIYNKTSDKLIVLFQCALIAKSMTDNESNNVW